MGIKLMFHEIKQLINNVTQATAKPKPALLRIIQIKNHFALFFITKHDKQESNCAEWVKGRLKPFFVA